MSITSGLFPTPRCWALDFLCWGPDHLSLSFVYGAGLVYVCLKPSVLVIRALDLRFYIMSII